MNRKFPDPVALVDLLRGLTRGVRRLRPLTSEQQAQRAKANEIAAHNEAVEARRRAKQDAKAMRRAAR